MNLILDEYTSYLLQVKLSVIENINYYYKRNAKSRGNSTVDRIQGRQVFIFFQSLFVCMK